MKSLLFNPGPTNVAEEVKKGLTVQDTCHREVEFFETLKRLNKNLVKIFNGEETHNAVLFVSSATGCNEAMIAAIHGKVLVLNNGKYSDRLCDIVDRYRIPRNRLKMDPYEPMNLELVEKVLQEDRGITHILMVHHETTTGVLAPLREIGKLAKQYGKLLCVDAVSAMGGHRFDLQEDNIAFCTVNANKCLESYPGVSFVIGRTEEIRKLEGKSRSFYFDLYAQWQKGQSGETPFTPAVQLVFAADVAVKQLLEEGVENRINRYQTLAKQMRNGLKELGFELLLLPDELQSNILTAIKMPDDMDYWQVHDKLKERGITIYSGKGVLNQRKFRIATMGSINLADVDWFLQNLKEVMTEVGLNPNR